MEQISVHLTDEVYEQYKAIAAHRGVTVDELLTHELSKGIDEIRRDIRRKTHAKPRLKVVK